MASGRRGKNAAVRAGIFRALSDVPRQALVYFWPQELSSRVLLCGTIAWGALLRLRFLREPIRFDEASNALYYAHRSFIYALAGGAANDNHTLNSVMVWLLVRLFGWSEATVRAPALIFGVLFIWSMFGFLQWSLRDRAAALAGAGLVAVSPWLIYFSVNARGYIHQAVILSLLTPVVIAGVRTATGRWLALGIWAGGLSVLGALCVRSMILFVGALLLGSATIALFGLCRSHSGFSDSSAAGAWAFLGVWLGAMLLLAAAIFGPLAMARGLHFLGGGLAGYGKQPLIVALRTTGQAFWAVVPLLVASKWQSVAWAAYGTLLIGLASLWQRNRLLLVFLLAFVAAGFMATPLLGFGLKPRFLPPGVVFLMPLLSLGLVRLLPHRCHWLAAPAVLLGFPVFLTNSAVFHRIHDTGHIPQAREEAKLLLAYDGLSRSLVVAPPLDDNGVAFYFIQAGRTQRNFASGYLRARQARDTCGLSQAIAFIPESPKAALNVRWAFARFAAQPWHGRLDFERSSIISRKDHLGALAITPLKDCKKD